MLEEKVLPWVQEVVGEQGVTLQQDGATSHTANSVQAWCRCNFKGFWEKELWPPSSPDLKPYGFWVMVYFRDKSLPYFSSKSGLSEAKIDIGMGRN